MALTVKHDPSIQTDAEESAKTAKIIVKYSSRFVHSNGRVSITGEIIDDAESKFEHFYCGRFSELGGDPTPLRYQNCLL